MSMDQSKYSLTVAVAALFLSIAISSQRLVWCDCPPAWTVSLDLD